MTKSKKIFVGRYAMNTGTVLLWMDPATGDSAAWHDWDKKSGHKGAAGFICDILPWNDERRNVEAPFDEQRRQIEDSRRELVRDYRDLAARCMARIAELSEART